MRDRPASISNPDDPPHRASAEQAATRPASVPSAPEDPPSGGSEAVSATQLVALLGAYAFLAVASGTMVHVTLPYVGVAFGVEASTYGWVLSGYLLSFGAFSAMHGRLAERFGLRRVYVLGAATFSLLAVFNALAPDIYVLIGSRMVQGAGATAMPALGATLVARLLPETSRGRAMGVIAACMGLAASIGPFLGGALVELGGWRLPFLFPAMGLLLVPAFLRTVPTSADGQTHDAPLDLVGAALIAGGCTALLVATGAARSAGTVSWSAIGLVAAGLMLLTTFRWWVGRATTPLLPPALLSDRGFQAVIATASLANAARFGVLVLIPILLAKQGMLGPLQIGAVLAPAAIATVLGAPLAGWAADQGAARPLAVVGALLVAVACACTSAAVGSPWSIAASVGLLGLGFVLVQTPMMTEVARMLPAEMVGFGNSLFMTTFFVGGALGTAIAVAGVGMMPTDVTAWMPGLKVDATTIPYANALLLQGVLALFAFAAATQIPRSSRRASRTPPNRGRPSHR